jgi:hypothetical protein
MRMIWSRGATLGTPTLVPAVLVLWKGRGDDRLPQPTALALAQSDSPYISTGALACKTDSADSGTLDTVLVAESGQLPIGTAADNGNTVAAFGSRGSTCVSRAALTMASWTHLGSARAG